MHLNAWSSNGCEAESLRLGVGGRSTRVCLAISGAGDGYAWERAVRLRGERLSRMERTRASYCACVIPAGVVLGYARERRWRCASTLETACGGDDHQQILP